MKPDEPIIAVFCGGVSSEREVSLGSGKAALLALAHAFPVQLFDIQTEAIPAGVDPRRHVVFSTLHGTFGEDGGMQRLLDYAEIAYAGCDAAASELCFNKFKTKMAVAAQGVQTARGLLITTDGKPSVDEVCRQLGEQVVFKPNCQGSSVGLRMVEGHAAVAETLSDLAPGEWVLEERIVGRELTVGLLGGRALGVVEVAPKSGRFDYESKYTKGLTEYFAPASLPDSVTAKVRAVAETAFAACGCRDYARIDFMLSQQGELYFLEINTLPGMKETSLLPMSARCENIDFNALTRALVSPAISRWRAVSATTHSL